MALICGLLIIAGVMLLLVIWCKWSLKTTQKRTEKNKERVSWYDERQTVAHGEAFRFSASVGLIYLLILYVCFKVWQSMDIEPVIAPSILIWGGLYLLLVSYHLCCLMTDSVIPLGEYSFSVKIYFIVGGLNLLASVFNCLDSGMPPTAENSLAWESLIMGAASVVIGVIHLIARSRNKRNLE